MIERLEGDCQESPFPITVRVRDACRLTGIGRSKLYELIAAGEIEIIKVDRITLLPVSGIQRFLDDRRNGSGVPIQRGGERILRIDE